MTNTRTLKPVAYFKAAEKHGILWGEDCCCADPVYSDYEDHEGEEVVNLAVYPAAAYEALQKENAELKRNHKFTCENLANTVPFIEELEQKNAAQAKRIEELYDVANDHRDSYIAASKALDSQKSEIESLRKQVEIANEYLNKLSCLGNGDCRGNSVGNYLAIEAIEKISEHRLGNEI